MKERERKMEKKKGVAASPRAARQKKVAFYRAMTVSIQREYGWLKNIRVEGKTIPIVLHEDAFWRATEPETGTTLTNGCMNQREAAESARERILVVGVKAFEAGQAAWKRIVLDGLSVAEYARKHSTLSGRKIDEYKAWVEEFRSPKGSAEPKAKPSISLPKSSPRTSKVTPNPQRRDAR